VSNQDIWSGETAKTVTLSAEDMRHARRLLRLLTATDSGEDSDTYVIADEQHPLTRLVTVAKLFLLFRQTRMKHFPPAMFGEPAWDILLVLYLNEIEQWAPTISSLAKAIGTPVTTTLRWIDYLDEKQLIERQPSEADRRASTVSLSERGRVALERHLSDVLGAVDAMRQEAREAERGDAAA
jgi:DNA-binding MarR family transcriptional regulator